MMMKSLSIVFWVMASFVLSVFSAPLPNQLFEISPRDSISDLVVKDFIPDSIATKSGPDGPVPFPRDFIPDSIPTKSGADGTPVPFPKRDFIPDSIATKSGEDGIPVAFPRDFIPDSIATKSGEDGIPVAFPRDFIPDSIATKSGEDGIPVAFPRDFIPDSIATKTELLYPDESEAPQELSETYKSRLSKIEGLDERNFRRKTETRDGKTIKMLSPVVLSRRITKLFEQGQLQQAVEMVQHSPPDAQNAVVWSTLIRFTMSQKKYKEAYKLFTDMKRRGIRPTLRTFGTLLQGYTQIEDWTSHTVQLKNVDNLWDQMSRFVEETGENEELNTIPFNALIKIYGKAGEYQKMYDVYNFLNKGGPFAPDIYTFTILLNSIRNRKTLALEEKRETADLLDTYTWSGTRHSHSAAEEEEEGEDMDSKANDPTAVAYRNASDARLIWRDLLKICGVPDAYAIRAVLPPLAIGRPSDQNLALDICHEFLGLSPPGEKAKRSPNTIPIDERTLNLLHSICRRSDLIRETLQPLLDSKRYKKT